MHSSTAIPDLMVCHGRRGYEAATELADEIYRKTGLPYRISHGLVANVVNQAVEVGVNATGVTVEMVDKAAVKYTGKPLGMTQEEIMACLDQVAFVESHDVAGGPAPKEVMRIIGLRRQELAEDEKRQAARKTRLEQGDKLLDQAVRDIVD